MSKNSHLEEIVKEQIQRLRNLPYLDQDNISDEELRGYFLDPSLPRDDPKRLRAQYQLSFEDSLSSITNSIFDYLTVRLPGREESPSIIQHGENNGFRSLGAKFHPFISSETHRIELFSTLENYFKNAIQLLALEKGYELKNFTKRSYESLAKRINYFEENLWNENNKGFLDGTELLGKVLLYSLKGIAQNEAFLAEMPEIEIKKFCGANGIEVSNSIKAILSAFYDVYNNQSVEEVANLTENFAEPQPQQPQVVQDQQVQPQVQQPQQPQVQQPQVQQTQVPQVQQPHAQQGHLTIAQRVALFQAQQPQVQQAQQTQVPQVQQPHAQQGRPTIAQRVALFQPQQGQNQNWRDQANQSTTPRGAHL